MNKRFLAAMLTAASLLGLGGCATIDRNTAGTVGGAVVGGLLGNAVGGTGATILGGAAGAYIGHQATRR